MSESSAIEWTDATWNPVTGCSKVSPGCAHCYAETLTRRFDREALPWTPENAERNVRLHPDRLCAPLRWRKPRRVFVNSMSDLFHERVPAGFIRDVFSTMALAPQHTFQVLTKRPDRMRRLFASGELRGRAATDWPLPNVWIGVSVENQRWADERVPLLIQTPAAVRFVSCEPLLGTVDLTRIKLAPPDHPSHFGEELDALRREHCDQIGVVRGIKPGIDWVIVGGESGPKRRPLDLAWVRMIREQCRNAGVAYFGKQLGGARPGLPLPGDLGDREWPR